MSHLPVIVIGTNYTKQSILELLQTNYPDKDFDYVLDQGHEGNKWSVDNIHKHFERITVYLQGSQFNILQGNQRYIITMPETKIYYAIDDKSILPAVCEQIDMMEFYRNISDKISILDAHY